MDMNFLDNKAILRGLLAQGDQMQTINGGVASMKITRSQSDEGIEFRLRVPSVRPEAYQVALNGDKLIVQVHVETPQEKTEGLFSIPMHQRIISIPAGINVPEIDAVHDGEALRIWMPYLSGFNPDLHPIEVRRAF